ncbi:DUF3854 domain-containing protein [Nostoc sp. FACHB-110]|nr:DUF3854 domain-containing protein [Nostoc sp. FACHB-110]
MEKPIPKKPIPTQAFWTPAIEQPAQFCGVGQAGGEVQQGEQGEKELFDKKAFSPPAPLASPAPPACHHAKFAGWTAEPAPNHLDPEHWQELVEKSAIHPQIAALNFESLHFSYVGGEHEAWNRLMISDKLKRTNTGGLTKGFLELYSHIDAGGWWCNSGVDPRSFASLAPGFKPTTKEWGCYKPNQPRPKKDVQGQVIPGKFIKYEHPPKVELSIFLLDVPDEIAQRIYALHKINPSDSDKACGFWFCVWKHNLPVTITEGAKKAASLLSQGHIAIGLPGISAGYRSPKDEFGQKIGKSYLAPELAVFATPKREIKFCFDYETKPETIVNIKRDISTTGWLLHRQGCSVKVITLPGPDKGVDDFLVAQGALAYERLSHEARSLRDWQYQNRPPQKTAYQPPRKLTSEEAQRKLATSSPNSPIKEPDHDNHQQPQQSTTRTNSNVNPETRPIVEQPGTTFHQNRSVGNSPSTVESNNPAVFHEPNRESQRVAIGTDSVLGDTSRLPQPRRIEQPQAHIRGLNPSSTSSDLRGEGTAHIGAKSLESHTTIVDHSTTDVHLRSRLYERVISAIANFLEVKQIARAINVEQIKTLINDLRSQFVVNSINTPLDANQNYQVDLALSSPQPLPQEQEVLYNSDQKLKLQLASAKAIDAITNFVEQKAVSSTLAQVLPSVTEQLVLYQEELTSQNKALHNLDQKLKLQLASAKAINAITNFVEQKAVSSTLAQVLPSITEQLVLHQEELTSQNKALHNLDQKLKLQLASAKAIDAITNFVEQKAVSSTLAQVLPSITEQLVLYQEELVNENKALHKLDQKLKLQLASAKAIDAITNYVEQKAVSSTLAEVLPSITEQLFLYQEELVNENKALHHLDQKLKLQLASAKAINAITNFVEQKAVSSTLAQVLPSITEQLVLYQEELVNENKALHHLDQKLKLQLASAKAINAIINFGERKQISSALAQVLPSLTNEVFEYQQELVSDHKIIQNLQQTLLEKLVTTEATKVIVDSLEENETNQETTEQLNSQLPRVITPELVQKTVDAIARFVEQRQVSAVLAEVVPALTKEITKYQQQLAFQNHQTLQALQDIQSHYPEPENSIQESQKYREQIELLSYQDFYNLAMYTKSYFEEHSETEDNPKTKALLIIRKIFRQMKEEALKNQQQSPKFKL